MQDESRFRNLVWFCIAVGAAVRVLFYIGTHYTSDDAFITYRYVQHILSGEGYTYNAGERVMGTSSPLYTLLLTFLGSLFGAASIQYCSLVVSVVAGSLVPALIWQLVPAEYSIARSIAVLFMMLYPKVLLIDVSGMESTCTLLLMFFSLWSYSRGLHYWTALSIGLHLLCRPDTVLWNSVLIIYILIREKTIRFRYLAAGAVLPVVWMLFSRNYFGTVVPHSMIAKVVSWHHLFSAFDPIRILSGYLPVVSTAGKSMNFMLFMNVLFLIPFCIGTWKLVTMRSPLVVMPIFFVLYNVAFSFGRIVMADWYYLPGYAAYFIVCGFCIEFLFSAMTNASLFMRMKFAVTLTAIVVLLTLDVWAAQRWRDTLSGLFLRQNDALGHWLHEHASSNQSVMVEPIGSIGYYSEMYVHDYIGLVSPSVVSFRKKYDSDAWYFDYIQTMRPTYLVLRNWEIPSHRLFHGYGDGIFHSEQERLWFDEHYEYIDWNNQSPQDSVYLVLYGLRLPAVAVMR